MVYMIIIKYCIWYDFLLIKIIVYFIVNRDFLCCLYIYIYIGFVEELNMLFLKKIMYI